MSVYFRSINKSMISAILVAMALFFTACSEDSGGTYPPAPAVDIIISGQIVNDENNISVDAAQVTIVNIETQQNALDPFYTGVDGMYSVQLPAGTYEVRVQAQGFVASPPAGVIGIPIVETSTFDVRLTPITGGPFGSLKLDLVNYSNSVGALVIIRKSATEQYSAVTSVGGALMMYNLPGGDYNISIQTIGHATYTSENNVTIVVPDEEIVDYIELTAINGFTVSGKVKTLAGSGDVVDVSLTDKSTKRVIPGTQVLTTPADFSISAVAPGNYYIRATYNIDGFVVDPDSIVKHGEPEVSILNENNSSAVIDITPAVELISPIAVANGIAVEITDLTPTFVWTAYPSTKEYVVEVVNANGVVIWGGFADDLTKKVTTADTTIVYAGPGLLEGEYYRWKVYASSDFEPINWVLISSSEEAQGVFRVVAP